MIEFFVHGEPVPQGSMVALLSKSTGKVFMKPSNEKKLKAWRKEVALAARQAWPHEPLNEPLRVVLKFYREAPATKAGDIYDDTGADKDKLTRAIYDGITGVILTNDNRIVEGSQGKYFASGHQMVGASVMIYGLNRKIYATEYAGKLFT